MKLKEWADKQGIAYLTAWRWFKAGDPRLANAYQSDSGTIIVPDENDSLEQTMAGNTQNDAMSVFLKKTVEFSKNNSTVEDFAAYVISNFSLKLNNVSDTPKYSRQKPKPEEVQKHFKQFLPDKQKEEQLKTVKNLIKEQAKITASVDPAADNQNELEAFLKEPDPFTRVVDHDYSHHLDGEFDELFDTLSPKSPQVSVIHMYDSQISTEGLVNRSVDLNTTPQQINYTGSTNPAFSSFNFTPTTVTNTANSLHPMNTTSSLPVSGTFDSRHFDAAKQLASFQPTQKEFQSAVKITETVEETPRKRGRPTKKR